MELFDTHVHLEDEAFAPDRDQVLARARAAGVSLLVNAGSTPAANRAAAGLAAVVPELYRACGLHPHEFPGRPLAETEQLRDELAQDKVVAVGELGLDYHLFPEFPAPDPAAQQAALRAQLRLARVFELPVILHVREAWDDALALLRAEGPFPAGGVMHCYSGGAARLPAVLELGLHLGLGATVTYPKAAEARAAARLAPADRLLLETDAPYLPPQDRRGRRNEPAWISETAAAVAAERGLPTAELAALAAANGRRLFRLEAGDPGALVYEIRGHLYVNLTNRCSADCAFCPRRRDRRLHGIDLTLRREPSAAEVLSAIGDPKAYAEIVFCGFGEPVLRLPALTAVGREVRARGGRVRVNTNGQADLIFGRDILPECRDAVDEWSVSVNTVDPEQYQRLVRPAVGPDALAAVQAFAARAVRAGFQVSATAVELPEVDVALLRAWCGQAGVRYRGRVPSRLGEPEERN